MMNRVREYDAIRYAGSFRPDLALAPGEIGMVLEDYGNGNYEVEFSFLDGTTWLQCALSGADLRLDDQITVDSMATPSVKAVYPAILSFERGDAQAFTYPPTGEILSVERLPNGRIHVSVPSIGTVTTVTRKSLAPGTE